MEISTQNLSGILASINKQGFKLKSIRVDWKSGEHEAYNLTKDEASSIHSCAKTVTALAVGICVSKGLITLDDTIISFFPDFNGNPYSGTEKITIKNLLNMTAGKHLRSLLTDPDNNNWKDDWLKWFLEFPLFSEPGTEFYYSAHNSYILGRIVESVTGVTFSDFVYRSIWTLLGVNKPYWISCPRSHTICAGGLDLSCEELSKIGVTLLNYGKYNNHLIVEQSFIENMLIDIVPSFDPFFDDAEGKAGYGYAIWKCSLPTVYRIWGAGGNFCIIDFNQGLCVTTTAETNLSNWKSYNDHDVLRMIYHKILRP